MSKTPAIAIFDVGKTNKKLFVFDEQYRIVFERQTSFPEAVDESGDPCDDLDRLVAWIREALAEGLGDPRFDIRGINFSAYGASFVYLGEGGRVLTPLYNYLKSYPQKLLDAFYGKYGGATAFSLLTASPRLGSLNAGMQLYRIKKERPALFSQIKYALHLPQFLAFLVGGKFHSDITSIGCHTNLWDFARQDYHPWVTEEGLLEKMAPLVPSTQVDTILLAQAERAVGVGLHDSSAALIPYLESFHDPFVLISTGTWCISLNPFNARPLTAGELEADCLCYLTYRGKPVKASRLFAGQFHEQEVGRLRTHFEKPADHFTTVRFDETIARRLKAAARENPAPGPADCFAFGARDLAAFASYEEAYTQLMIDIVAEQKRSLELVLKDTGVRRVFVDGGFGRNALFMHLLAEVLPGTEVFAASVPQATALGAALAVHRAWNSQPLPGNIIDLKFYSPSRSETP